MLTKAEQFLEYFKCRVDLILWLCELDVFQRAAMLQVAELIDKGDVDPDDYDGVFEAYISKYNEIGGREDEEYTENDNIKT